jgi:hypothetical protein
VSPVVAELVTNELDTLPAVVTAIGEVAEPEIKPLSDATGPENVVLAILISSHARFVAYLSACRQPGLSDMPDNPGIMPIYTTGYKRKGEPKLPFFS